jgi:hypothetical protein
MGQDPFGMRIFGKKGECDLSRFLWFDLRKRSSSLYEQLRWKRNSGFYDLLQSRKRIWSHRVGEVQRDCSEALNLF